MIELNVSKFGSLNFVHDWRTHFQKQLPYTQIFSPDDLIYFQYTYDAGAKVVVRLTDLCEEKVEEVECRKIYEDEKRCIDEVVMMKEVGCYRMEILREDVVILQTIFKVLEGDDLKGTIHLRYTHDQNEFDVVFDPDGYGPKYADFRFEGGFFPGDTTFGVESNEFRDQRYTLTQLSALPYEVQTLTIGSSLGVPRWVAEKLNIIFSCSVVSVNGKTMTRSGGSVPTRSDDFDKSYPLHVYTMELEGKDFYNLEGIDLNELWILRTGKWDDNGVWLPDGIWKSA